MVGILHADGFVLLEHADDVRHVVAAIRIEIHRRRIDDVLERRRHVFGAALVVQNRRADVVAGEVAALEAVG